ncbi:glycosyltransferase family protein [Streptomyces scabiei]|uniref:glycosyltransferase family protein n=1 Tax=Streptomyces scabiei TaxID=1930 RepID=UPI001B30AF09|nr:MULTISPECIES: glycosyltransferase [Streptomyces]MBP5870822.1 glycosyltransferase family 4 protein [Streptomyces sp. LBUM 1485]MBP5913271.1 glycosyltransferase family 4 protein [Streptomyces sp. LBUM 1486]MDX2532258.1 glycosyltransferase [Streptomyces scabiei]MDX2794564.1 glycosyltransferase [Streptomyces scabiei]MDX3822434.1 glycosyltransferase [Streptomyces scabiei]
MKVVVYPADAFGCGSFRMRWPGEACAKAGHDVRVVEPNARKLRVVMEGNAVKDVLDVDADVVVLQRVTHAYMAQAVGIMRAKGITVVVDVDDDLSSIHPSNPAWQVHRPGAGLHSWHNVALACRNASLVTVSTPALLDVYARHGRGHVLPNYLPDYYYGLPRVDSDTIGWPGSYHSHPNDPESLGGAVARLVDEGAEFVMRGDSTGAGRAFGLAADPPGGPVPIEEWPRAVASLGIGIAPLADTKFNRAKSWLKPLEMSACGVPWVASPRAEYERLHKLGAGVLADRPRAWHRELKRLRESPQLRAELSESGRAVAEGLRLRDNAWRWAEAWQKAYKLQQATLRTAVPV